MALSTTSVNIEGLDRVVLLQELWFNIKGHSMSIWTSEMVTQARELLSKPVHIDQFAERPIHLYFASDVLLSPEIYNSNANLSASQVVCNIRRCIREKADAAKDRADLNSIYGYMGIHDSPCTSSSSSSASSSSSSGSSTSNTVGNMKDQDMKVVTQQVQNGDIEESVSYFSRFLICVDLLASIVIQLYNALFD